MLIEKKFHVLEILKTSGVPEEKYYYAEHIIDKGVQVLEELVHQEYYKDLCDNINKNSS